VFGEEKFTPIGGVSLLTETEMPARRQLRGRRPTIEGTRITTTETKPMLQNPNFSEIGWLLPVGVFHLLTANDDLTQRPFQFQTRVTLCCEVVQPSSLPPSPFPEGEEIDRNPRYCAECVREAVRWSAGG
jgi:hypothetical protein